MLASDAEKAIEDFYRRVQLPGKWVTQLTKELEDEIISRQAEASEARVALTKKLAALADERQKLLRAYYANAIPLGLLKADQIASPKRKRGPRPSSSRPRPTSKAGRRCWASRSSSPATATPLI